MTRLFNEPLDSITQSWRFIAIVVGLYIGLLVVSPIATSGYDFARERADVEAVQFAEPLLAVGPIWRAVFKALPILVTFGAILFPRRGSRIFAVYVALNYVLIFLRQGVSLSEPYGLVVFVHTSAMILIVAAAWAWEILAGQNDFTRLRSSPAMLWVIPLAVVAFWYPLNPLTLRPDFSPATLLYNGAGLAFCMMTPVYLAVLLAYFPRVNFVTVRVTSLLGTLAAVSHIYINFIARPQELWWNGILHLPLLAISAWGLKLSYGHLKWRPLLNGAPRLRKNQ